MSSSNLVLPYVVEDSTRKVRFSEDMEAAALLCIAEAGRKKKSGLLGKTVETLAFLSKLHYPFWAVAWGDDCLLIDGMGGVSSNIIYFKLPDVEAFIEHLKRSTAVEESYHSALRSHRETFSKFTSHSEVSMEGLIIDQELLSDMVAFAKDGQAEADVSACAASLLQPKIDREKAVEIGEKVLGHYNMVQSEMKGLQFAVETVDEETKKHIDKLRQELGQIQERYELRISSARSEFEKRKEELEKERDEKIKSISGVHEKEVNARLEEKQKWERELVGLEQDKSEYEKRKELRKRKDDEIGETRWSVRLREVQNRISTVKEKIKTLSGFISRSNKETEKAIKNVHDAYLKLIDDEEKRVIELEGLRQAEVEKKESEIEELQQEASAIREKIECLIEQQQERFSALEEATIPLKIETTTLIYLPFYVIRYETDKERRSIIRSPVIAREHEGLVMKIRKALKGHSLQSKINTLLKPRSNSLEKILVSLEERIADDKALQKNIDTLGAANNLLAASDFQFKVTKGLEELEAEGWVKPEEKTAVLEVYAPK